MMAMAFVMMVVMMVMVMAMMVVMMVMMVVMMVVVKVNRARPPAALNSPLLIQTLLSHINPMVLDFVNWSSMSQQ